MKCWHFISIWKSTLSSSIPNQQRKEPYTSCYRLIKDLRESIALKDLSLHGENKSALSLPEDNFLKDLQIVASVSVNFSFVGPAQFCIVLNPTVVVLVHSFSFLYRVLCTVTCKKNIIFTGDRFPLIGIESLESHMLIWGWLFLCQYKIQPFFFFCPCRSRSPRRRSPPRRRTRSRSPGRRRHRSRSSSNSSR